MCEYMRQLVEQKKSALSTVERCTLSLAYKKVVAARRASWRTIMILEEEQKKLLQQQSKMQQEQAERVSSRNA